MNAERLSSTACAVLIYCPQPGATFEKPNKPKLA